MHPGDPGGARSRLAGRRRPRQPFLLSSRAQGDRRRHHSDHARRRHPRLQYPCAGAGRNAGRACRRREPSVRRPGQIQPGAGDELDDGARPHAGAGGADGHVASGRNARPVGCNRRVASPGMEADVTVLTQKPGRYVLRDNEKTEVSPTVCCSRCSACAPACVTTRSRRSCRRPSRPRSARRVEVETADVAG